MPCPLTHSDLRPSTLANKQIWIVPGDIILLSLRDFQDDRADVIHKYTADEARNLKTYGELKSDFSINENAGDGTWQRRACAACELFPSFLLLLPITSQYRSCLSSWFTSLQPPTTYPSHFTLALFKPCQSLCRASLTTRRRIRKRR